MREASRNPIQRIERVYSILALASLLLIIENPIQRIERVGGFHRWEGGGKKNPIQRIERLTLTHHHQEEIS